MKGTYYYERSCIPYYSLTIFYNKKCIKYGDEQINKHNVWSGKLFHHYLQQKEIIVPREEKNRKRETSANRMILRLLSTHLRIYHGYIIDKLILFITRCKFNLISLFCVYKLKCSSSVCVKLN